VVEGYNYDRREPTCCVPWDFSEGEIFTVVGFNKVVREPTRGPLPPTYPGHIGWWISFDTHEVPEKSHYSLVQYTNDPDVQFQDFANMHENLAMFMLSGGTSYDTQSWTYHVFQHVVFVYKHPLALPLFIMACVVFVRILRGLVPVFQFVKDGSDPSPFSALYTAVPQHEAQD
jgi:hypothetical protein